MADPSGTFWYRVGWREDSGTEVRSGAVRYAGVKSSVGSQIFPNPSSGRATIDWATGLAGNVDIRLYDLAGREVAVVVRDWYEAGRHRAFWTGTTPNGGRVRPGVYTLRIRDSDGEEKHRLLILR